MRWRSDVVHAVVLHAALVFCTGRADCRNASKVGARHTIIAGCSDVYSRGGASSTVVHDVLPEGTWKSLRLCCGGVGRWDVTSEP